MKDEEIRSMVESIISTDDADTASMLVGITKISKMASTTYLTLVADGVPEDAARDALIQIVLYSLSRGTSEQD